MAPGITWANDGADGGDLITAVATGGVPHPTGYPTYLLLASLFLKIPFGSLAYRTNLLSCVCTVAASLVIYKIVYSMDRSIFSASISSLAFGTFPLVWSQAIITEVYALNGLFTALILYFFVTRHSHSFTDVIGGIVAGLGLGNHLTIFFLLPLMFVNKTSKDNNPIISESRRQSIFLYIKIVVRRLIGLGMGLSAYLLIPFRARAQAPINWGNAVNWDGFVWLVTGKMYWGRLDNFNGAYLLVGIQAWSRFMILQLGIFGLLLVLIVLAVLFKANLPYIASGWIIIIYSIFSILYYSPDSYVYLIPALLALSAWMGLGSRWLAAKIQQIFPSLHSVAAASILILIIGRAVLAIPAINLSSDRKAEQYGLIILKSAPEHAIIFAAGDEGTFSLWYQSYLNHQRSDVAVVSSDLLIQPWYRDVLTYTYPNLVVPLDPQIQDIIRNNPHRPACLLAPDLQASLECSP